MRILLIIVAALALTACSSKKKTLRQEFTVVSYNVENLFDTLDDPTIPDEEFLPESEKKWTPERYQKKLDDITQVITEINPNELPELVGLIEVENRSVLEDLVSNGKLNGHYGIVHEESPDYRGIDVALIYRKDEFKVLAHEVLPVSFADDPEFKTRDILHVTGLVGKKQIHVFVNHWPSRIGGNQKTEPKRVMAATLLKQKVDELLAADPKAMIVIMGDMNDEPLDKSLAEILGARSPGSGATLVNLMIPEDEQQMGTYFFNSEWNMLDNLVVSKSLLTGSGIRVENGKGSIYRNDWMTYTNKDGIKTPNRTFVGQKYVAGVSDHFPVYFKLIVK